MLSEKFLFACLLLGCSTLYGAVLGNAGTMAYHDTIKGEKPYNSLKAKVFEGQNGASNLVRAANVLIFPGVYVGQKLAETQLPSP